MAAAQHLMADIRVLVRLHTSQLPQLGHDFEQGLVDLHLCSYSGAPWHAELHLMLYKNSATTLWALLSPGLRAALRALLVPEGMDVDFVHECRAGLRYTTVVRLRRVH